MLPWNVQLVSLLERMFGFEDLQRNLLVVLAVQIDVNKLVLSFEEVDG